MRLLLSNNQEVLTSAQRSAGSGTSNTVNANSCGFANLVIFITAKSGVPTLSVSLQSSAINPSIDNTKWRTVYTEDTLTNAMIGTPPKIFAGHRQTDFTGWLRISYTIAGTSTPKITFSANIESK